MKKPNTSEAQNIKVGGKIPERYETRTILMKHKIKRNEITKSMIPDVTPMKE